MKNIITRQPILLVPCFETLVARNTISPSMARSRTIPAARYLKGSTSSASTKARNTVSAKPATSIAIARPVDFGKMLNFFPSVFISGLVVFSSFIYDCKLFTYGTIIAKLPVNVHINTPSDGPSGALCGLEPGRTKGRHSKGPASSECRSSLCFYTIYPFRLRQQPFSCCSLPLLLRRQQCLPTGRCMPHTSL